MKKWLRLSKWLKRQSSPGRAAARKATRPGLERLEERCTPAAFLVQNTNDSGAGSLRQALLDAGVNSEADTIQFAAGLAGQTITLTSADANTAFGPTGLVVNNDNITIDGGTGGITISGNNARRVFAVTSTGTLTLEHLTVTGGLAQGGNGGRASGSGGGGGAGLGGAICNAGTLNVIQATVSSNQAVGGAGGGGSSGGNGGGGGGGGGLGGNGGNGSSTGSYGSAPGGGGGGLSGDGGNFSGTTGGGGGPGGSGGANGSNGTSSPASGGVATGAGGGGGGSGVSGNGGTGGAAGFGGGGGGAGGGALISGANGGAGGFGGGGGGAGTGGSRGVPGVGGFGAGGGGGGSGSTAGHGGGGGGAGLGGAIFNFGGTVNISDSTFTNDTATGGAAGNNGATAGKGYGGAIFNRNGTVTLLNCTISGNTAPDGGRGVYNLGDGATATATVSNTIIAQADTAVTDFVGNSVNGGTNATGGTGDLIRSQSGFTGTVVSTADPQLGAPADNGGPTRTMAIATSSPAFNAGDNAAASGLAGDQRGLPRIDGAAVDIGAFEVATTNTIRGTVFNDLNNNGTRDSGEPSLAGLTVFLDLNGDGSFETGEPVAVSAADGSYTLTTGSAGTFQVLQVLPAGWQQTAPGGGGFSVALTGGTTLAGRDFADVPATTVVGVYPQAVLFPAHVGDPNIEWLYGTYRAVLNRDPDSLGLAVYGSWLDQGAATRDQVAQAIWESREHRGLQVDGYYLTYLGRPSDAAGRSFWVNEFLGGADEATVVQGFLTSSEYQALHATNSAFVQSLYADLLGRPAQGGEDAYWMNQLNGPTGPASVVQGFLASDEFTTLAVDSFFSAYLHRAAGAADLSYWLGQPRTGGSLESTGLGFLL